MTRGGTEIYIVIYLFIYLFFTLGSIDPEG